MLWCFCAAIVALSVLLYGNATGERSSRYHPYWQQFIQCEGWNLFYKCGLERERGIKKDDLL